MKLANVLFEIRSIDKSNKFNLEEFKSLERYDSYPDDSLNALYDYARPRLERIGEGSSRIVFALSNRYALKLAKSKRTGLANQAREGAGIAQNIAEQRISKRYPAIVAKVLDSSKTGTWIISELVRPLKDSPQDRILFLESTGIKWIDFLDGIYDEFSEDFLETNPQFQSNKFFEELVKLHQKTGVSFEDFGRLNQFGVTPDRRVVILDYGFTDDVQYNYYSGW